MIKKKTFGKTANLPEKKSEQDNCQKKARTSDVSEEGNQSDKKTTADDQPSVSEANGAGTFDGDLRDLPRTAPIRKERPKREDPKIKPKVLVKDEIIKPDQE